MIKDVDALIADKHRSIRFPDPIEALFNDKRKSYLNKAMTSTVASSIFYYNIFLPADCFLVPGTIWLSVAAHALITGWLVAAAFLFKSFNTLYSREIVGVSIPILMAFQILSIYFFNKGIANAEDYQYFSVMIVVFMNVNLRPDFCFAVGASLFVFVAYTSALVAGHAAFSTVFVRTAIMAAAVYLTLVANWRMEQDARHAFLRGLQDRLHRDQAEADAGHDPLTGLFNRRYLNERARALWETAHPSTPMAVLMLDVDHFKGYNDIYGHLGGDLCLKHVAATMRSEMRDQDDLCVRFGGEEFVALLPGADLMTATRMAERIRRLVENRTIVNKAAKSGYLSISVGVASAPVSTMTLSDLTAHADAALYAAKRNGRNQVWPPLMSADSIVADMRMLPRVKVA